MNGKHYLKVIRGFLLVVMLGISFLVGQVSNVSAQESNKNQDIKTNIVNTVTEKSKSIEQKTLYQRLGGYDAISAVVDSFADKLFSDKKIAKFFRGMGDDTRKQFRQKNKNLVCKVTGGPCKIISRSAKTTHGGLGITEKDFNIVFNHLVDTLDEFEVPKAEKKELLDIVLTLKPDIVEKKK